MSILAVLATPLTTPPSALASCTVKVPTPPDAPTTSTRCPASRRPTSVSACRAVPPEIAATPACWNVMLAGL